MSAFRHVTPRLPVAKLSLTVAFYHDLLGFAIDVAWPPEDPTFVMLERDGTSLGFFAPTDHQPGPIGYAELYIEVTDAQALHDRLAALLPIEWGPEVYAYGRREFAFRDPDRYLVIITEPTTDPPTISEPH